MQDSIHLKPSPSHEILLILQPRIIPPSLFPIPSLIPSQPLMQLLISMLPLPLLIPLLPPHPLLLLLLLLLRFIRYRAQGLEMRFFLRGEVFCRRDGARFGEAVDDGVLARGDEEAACLSGGRGG
jgi:hypothetical protein